MTTTTVELPDGNNLTINFGLDGPNGVYADLSTSTFSANVDLNASGVTTTVYVPVDGASIQGGLDVSPTGISGGISIPLPVVGTLLTSITADIDGLSASITTPPIVSDIPVNTISSGDWSYFGNWSESYYLAEVANATVDVIQGFISGVSALSSLGDNLASGNVISAFEDTVNIFDSILSQENNSAFSEGPSKTVQDISVTVGIFTVTIPIVTTFDVTVESGDQTQIDQQSVEIGSLTLAPSALLSVGNGTDNSANLTVDGNFFNAGEVDVKYAGSITLDGVLTQSGSSAVIDVDNGTINAGTISGGVLQSVDGGTMDLKGALTLTDGAVVLASSGSLVNVEGTITGGALVTDGTGMIQVSGVTLSGVAIDGTLIANSGVVYIADLPMGPSSGSGAINLGSGGAVAELVFQNTQTIDNVTITLAGFLSSGGGHGSGITDVDTSGAGGQILTLGSGLVINSTGYASLGGDAAASYFTGYPSNQADSIVNDGTINVVNDMLLIDPTSFANAGTIDVDAGATLSFGTINNVGGTIELGSGGTVSLLSGEIDGGTIVDDSEGLNNADGLTLSGVTYDGTMNLATGFIYIAGGLILNGSGGSGAGAVNLGSGGDVAELAFENTQTIDNATITLAGFLSSVASQRL